MSVSITSPRRRVPLGALTSAEWLSHGRRSPGAARPPIMSQVAQMMNEVDESKGNE